jgi:predicted lactoylglutathione lyase
MTKQIWINLPVKNLTKSRAFFTQLGFTFNEGAGNTENSACMIIGDKHVVVMLFTETMFKGFTSQPITDTQFSNEVLFSIDAESREEVDALAIKVVNAGGELYTKPAENQGWMYGCGFKDLDGHR